MMKRLQAMENENDYLQKKQSDYQSEIQNKDHELEKLHRLLMSLRAENLTLKKKLDSFEDAHQAHDTVKLINECRSNSQKRVEDIKRKLNSLEDAHQAHDTVQLIKECRSKSKKRGEDNKRDRNDSKTHDEINYELQIKQKMFDASRRAAGKIRDLSGDKSNGVDEIRNKRVAEFDAIRNNYRQLGIASSRLSNGISIEEARRII